MTRMLALATVLLAIARTAAGQPTAAPASPGESTAAPAAPPPTAETTPPAAEPAPPAETPAAAAPAATPAAPAAAPPESPPAQPAPAVAPAPPPPPPPAATQQQQQRRRPLYTWGSIGTTFAYGQTYGSASFGVGYLMQAGIAPNVEASYVFGNSPTMWALKPGVTWFMPVPRFQPYVGAYYTHWFVNGSLPDENGVGARAGFSLGRMISLGVTYDRALNCEKNCESWSPQVAAGFSM
ncbi:hypothetical protein [Anaeromyxobacter oryzae]|uniref:Uncharacterized protein n=1 Tax=Anaeromyxobacter oryzae TaxID=2918170 RepID=A0ABN6MUZ3_9BACT|nr:hypothetical protein [Anaeromyxobacter oryzae]BDG04730.1 hypothetical protein AMOR_37260 [Anaeromyxobacter oryzae]